MANKNLTTQVTHKEARKIFFPNLDGLRFIAFFAVFFHHTLIVSCFAPDTGSPLNQFIFSLKENGALGVNLFFVLSGFLITYLLLSEKKEFGKINIPNFYMRRVLRIWPLYYTMVAAGFILFPFIKKITGGIPNETHSPAFYLFFISNFEMIRKGFADSSILNVLWSVGVEEQFYLVWPVLLFLVPAKHLMKIFMILLGITLFFRWYNMGNNQINYFHSLAIFSDMVVGGISAWLVFSFNSFKEIIKKISKKIIVLSYATGLVLILLRYMLFSNPVSVIFERLLFSLFFAFVILEQNFADNSFYKLGNNSFLTKWGNYTYGLYCLHTIGLLGAHIISEHLLHLHNNWLIMLFDYTFGLVLTMIMARLSYKLLEAPFLKLKNKFAYFIKQ
jgi:peptidoglycan/LPS O-acetylase OafA/YrhL